MYLHHHYCTVQCIYIITNCTVQCIYIITTAQYNVSTSSLTAQFNVSTTSLTAQFNVSTSWAKSLLLLLLMLLLLLRCCCCCCCAAAAAAAAAAVMMTGPWQHCLVANIVPVRSVFKVNDMCVFWSDLTNLWSKVPMQLAPNRHLHSVKSIRRHKVKSMTERTHEWHSLTSWWSHARDLAFSPTETMSIIRSCRLPYIMSMCITN